MSVEHNLFGLAVGPLLSELLTDRYGLPTARASHSFKSRPDTPELGR